MSLTSMLFDPFAPVRGAIEEDPFFSSTSLAPYYSTPRSVLGSRRADLPPHMHCDIMENNTHYCICCELAGVCKENLNVEIVGDDLTLCADKEDKCAHELGAEAGAAWTYKLRERSFGKIRRTFRLPQNINKDSVSTEFKDGSLRIHFDKLTPGMGGSKKLMIA